MRIIELMRTKWIELTRVNIRELSLENITVWPDLLKAIVLAVIFILVLTAGHYLFNVAQYESLETAKQQEKTLKIKVRIDHQILINIKKDTLQIQTVKTQFNLLRANFARPNETPTILDNISKLGAVNQLKFNLLKPLAEKTEEFYTKAPIQIVVEGTYHQLVQFMSELANYQRFITFDTFKLGHSSVIGGKAKEDNLANVAREVLQLDLTASIYYYLDEKNPYENPIEKTPKKTAKKT